jgi:hypothetical protein
VVIVVESRIIGRMIVLCAIAVWWAKEVVGVSGKVEREQGIGLRCLKRTSGSIEDQEVRPRLVKGWIGTSR